MWSSRQPLPYLCLSSFLASSASAQLLRVLAQAPGCRRLSRRRCRKPRPSRACSPACANISELRLSIFRVESALLQYDGRGSREVVVRSIASLGNHRGASVRSSIHAVTPTGTQEGSHSRGVLVDRLRRNPSEPIRGTLNEYATGYITCYTRNPRNAKRPHVGVFGALYRAI
eukprot:2795074-Pleurochrysis_carterae.AAC.1